MYSNLGIDMISLVFECLVPFLSPKKLLDIFPSSSIGVITNVSAN